MRCVLLPEQAIKRPRAQAPVPRFYVNPTVAAHSGPSGPQYKAALLCRNQLTLSPSVPCSQPQKRMLASLGRQAEAAARQERQLRDQIDATVKAVFGVRFRWAHHEDQG